MNFTDNSTSSYFACSDRATLGGAFPDNPMLLRNVRLDKFQATFSVRRTGSPGPFNFVFNAKDEDQYNYITVYHTDQSAYPSGGSFVDGHVATSVSAASFQQRPPHQWPPTLSSAQCILTRL
jgi:hypothetical protein